jgi:hypothetical protein
VFVAFFGTKTYLQEFKANGLARWQFYWWFVLIGVALNCL